MQDYQAHTAYKINGRLNSALIKITKAANVTAGQGKLV